MAAGSNSESELKQQVFGRLAFLGMPQGDAAKIAQLSINLAMAGSQAPSFQSDTKKLTRALSQHVGKPRAHLFAKWLIERIPKVCETVAVPKLSSLISATDSNPRVSQTLVPEGHLQATVASQPSSASTNSATSRGLVSTKEKAVLDESWVEVKSKEGKAYFWNRSKNTCNWALPVGIRAKWVSHKSNEGRTYYSDRNGHTTWVLPPLQKPSPAMKPSDDSLNTQADLAFLREQGLQFESPVLALPSLSVHTSSPAVERQDVVPVPAATKAVGLSCAALEAPVSACPSPLRKRKLDETQNARDGEQSVGAADSWGSWAQDTLGVVWDKESEAPDSPDAHSDAESTSSSSSVASRAAVHTRCEEPKKLAVAKPTNCGDCPQMCSPSKEESVHNHHRVRSRSPRRDVCAVAKHGKCKSDKILLASSPRSDVCAVAKHGKCKSDKILLAARQGDVGAVQQSAPAKAFENLPDFMIRRTQLCRQASNGGA